MGIHIPPLGLGSEIQGSGILSRFKVDTIPPKKVAIPSKGREKVGIWDHPTGKRKSKGGSS